MQKKKIFIIDESGFSRICSALLTQIGYSAEIVPHVDELPSGLTSDNFGLIVTSYPYSLSLLDEIKERKIPTLTLSDNIDSALMRILNEVDNSYCMIKPVDYEKFRCLIQQVMNGELTACGGFNIV